MAQYNGAGVGIGIGLRQASARSARAASSRLAAAAARSRGGREPVARARPRGVGRQNCAGRMKANSSSTSSDGNGQHAQAPRGGAGMAQDRRLAARPPRRLAERQQGDLAIGCEPRRRARPDDERRRGGKSGRAIHRRRVYTDAPERATGGHGGRAELARDKTSVTLRASVVNRRAPLCLTGAACFPKFAAVSAPTQAAVIPGGILQFHGRFADERGRRGRPFAGAGTAARGGAARRWPPAASE